MLFDLVEVLFRCHTILNKIYVIVPVTFILKLNNLSSVTKLSLFNGIKFSTLNIFEN